MLDDYADHQSFAEIDPTILKLNFIQFASQYFVKDSSLKKEKSLSLLEHSQPIHPVHKVNTMGSFANISY